MTMLLDDIKDDLLRVFHLRDGAWHRVDWASWSRFRDVLKQGFAPLPHVGAGEHHFVVCVVRDGRLRNILPHRYLIDDEGRRIDDHYFGVLSESQIARFEALNERYYEEVDPLTEARATYLRRPARPAVAMLAAAGRNGARAGTGLQRASGRD
jgi:hypothetical protein